MSQIAMPIKTVSVYGCYLDSFVIPKDLMNTQDLSTEAISLKKLNLNAF